MTHEQASYLYDRLFQVSEPGGDDFSRDLNPKSLETLVSCRVESGLAGASPGSRCQLERLGYFCIDSKDSSSGKLVLNRIVPLRDSWAKVAGQKV